MGERRYGLCVAALVAVLFAAAPGRASAQPAAIDLSSVNDANDWAAGCDIDASGNEYCAIQKSSGPRALGYVVLRRDDDIARQVRISVDSVLIDPGRPVSIRVDQNEPLVWDVGYRVIERNMISLIGQDMDELISQLQTGERVVVTVMQKTGDAIIFELSLEGFNQAIAALERTTGTAAAAE